MTDDPKKEQDILRDRKIYLKRDGEFSDDEICFALRAIYEYLPCSFRKYSDEEGRSPLEKTTISRKRGLFRKPEKICDLFTGANKEGFMVVFRDD